MPERSHGRPAAPDQERPADHAAIERLAGSLLPALVDRLGASGLGEIEVREGAWRLRLRMPAGERRAGGTLPGDPLADGDRRPEDGGDGQAANGADGDLDAGLQVEGGLAEAADAPTTNGRGQLVKPTMVVAPDGPTAAVDGAADPAPGADVPPRAVAVAPAVGFFRPRPGLAHGARVRAGERVGFVDVLGVPQDIVAPVEGTVGSPLVEVGEPVEYGQEVLEIHPAAPRAPRAAKGGA